MNNHAYLPGRSFKADKKIVMVSRKPIAEIARRYDINQRQLTRWIQNGNLIEIMVWFFGERSGVARRKSYSLSYLLFDLLNLFYYSSPAFADFGGER